MKDQAQQSIENECVIAMPESVVRRMIVDIDEARCPTIRYSGDLEDMRKQADAITQGMLAKVRQELHARLPLMSFGRVE